MVTRTQIVEAARSYVGLPFNGPSRGFLLAVAQRLALTNTNPDALRGKSKSEHGIAPGDVVVVRVGWTSAQHAIVTRHPNGELCLVRPLGRKIVEHRIDQRFHDRILQVFELRGVSDEQFLLVS